MCASLLASGWISVLASGCALVLATEWLFVFVLGVGFKIGIRVGLEF